eukprot:CAMPEP_0172537808 /NCGR_PEP_ID=MMETSP1067-20121228/9339_1 /TAXON_ID=265564 ORGANISM="Thalassiosira punctigera, Strain Tpunct2005C2" /NCGR_SAMPLE_ID=MMETSP1067 /ASSEMBLY_ACC=CAM_ASM_000444 /LENGTH=533 /DNA_ID=CAMNT_0013323183 /DNA_START=222 /DNA_END=1823 /DNA_ORIENTATION=+
MPSTSQSQVLRTLLSTKVDKLYGLKDISTARFWDYSLPTIVSPRRRAFTDRANFKSDESFLKILDECVNGGLPYRILESAGVFKRDNDIVLYGGCLLDIIMKRPDAIKDFDLHLVGEAYVNDEARCVARAKEFVACIFSFIERENRRIDEEVAKANKERRHFHAIKCNLHEVTVSRARSTVTLHFPPVGSHRECIFQLTFAPSKNITELLTTCSPHCARLAMKDGAVVMDHMARYCIESTCIVLDTPSFANYYCGEADDEAEQARRTTSGRTIAFQMGRYIKHFEEKGFDLILPELDMSKVPRRNLAYGVPEVLALPNLTVVYERVDRNQIVAKSLSSFRNGGDGSGLVGEYDARPAPNVGIVVHHNIRCLVNDVHDSFRFVARGERWDHVFDYVPSLTPRMVRKSYETVLADIALDNGSLPISKLTGYFSVTSPDEIVERLIVEPLRKGICRRGSLPKPYSLDADELKRLAEVEISSLIEKIGRLRETLKGGGLDKLVIPFAENVSTDDEVFDALYGPNGLKRGLKRKAEEC